VRVDGGGWGEGRGVAYQAGCAAEGHVASQPSFAFANHTRHRLTQRPPPPPPDRQVLIRRELDEAAKALGERIRTGQASCEVGVLCCASGCAVLCCAPGCALGCAVVGACGATQREREGGAKASSRLKPKQARLGAHTQHRGHPTQPMQPTNPPPPPRRTTMSWV